MKRVRGSWLLVLALLALLLVACEGLSQSGVRSKSHRVYLPVGETVPPAGYNNSMASPKEKKRYPAPIASW